MIKVIKRGGDGMDENYKEFAMTSSDDVQDLPNSQTPWPNKTTVGSLAYTQDLASAYMLGLDDTWREV